LPQLKVVDREQPGGGQTQPMGAGAIGFFRPALRGAARGAAPRPEWRAQRNPTPDPAAQQQWDNERRRLEASLTEERAALQRQHERETQAPPPDVTPDRLRRRQAAEQRVFEMHATQSRRVLETRWRNHLVNPVPQKATWQPAGQERR
jgi:hypothetical protein